MTNNVGSKNLQQVRVPISNCPVLEKRLKVDFSKQICAGGEEGNDNYTATLTFLLWGHAKTTLTRGGS